MIVVVTLLLVTAFFLGSRYQWFNLRYRARELPRYQKHVCLCTLFTRNADTTIKLHEYDRARLRLVAIIAIELSGCNLSNEQLDVCIDRLTAEAQLDDFPREHLVTRLLTGVMD